MDRKRELLIGWEWLTLVPEERERGTGLVNLIEHAERGDMGVANPSWEWLT